jgi:hypothetical protein
MDAGGRAAPGAVAEGGGEGQARQTALILSFDLRVLPPRRGRREKDPIDAARRTNYLLFTAVKIK